jgi:hypothetical protein
VVRVLAIAGPPETDLYSRVEELRPDLVIGCGGLPFDYLETLAAASGAPVLWVPGAHDPEVSAVRTPAMDSGDVPTAPPGPHGCINIDGRVVTGSGLNIAGIGGGISLELAPNRYSPRQMDKRVSRFRMRHGGQRITGRRPPDVIVTHLSPLPIDGRPADHHPKFVSLIKAMRPRVAIHGGQARGHAVDDRHVGRVPVIHPMPWRILELE